MGPQLTQRLFEAVRVIGHDPRGLPDSCHTAAADGGRLRVGECRLRIGADQLARGDEVLCDELRVVLRERTQLGADLLRQLTAGDPFGDGRALWELGTVVPAVCRASTICRASATSGILAPTVAATVLSAVVEASTLSPLVTAGSSVIATTVEAGTAPLITAVAPGTTVTTWSSVVSAGTAVLPRAAVTTVAAGAVLTAAGTAVP